MGGESERGGIGENVHKQKQLEPRARAIEVMQMMIMTARRGAWREGGRGNGAIMIGA